MTTLKKIYYYVLIIIENLLVESTLYIPKSSFEACCMVLGSAAMGFIGGTISGVILSCFDIVSTTSSAASVVADLPVSEDLLKQFEADLYGTPEAQKQAALAKKGPSISTVLAILGLSAMAFIGVALKVYHP